MALVQRVWYSWAAVTRVTPVQSVRAAYIMLTDIYVRVKEVGSDPVLPTLLHIILSCGHMQHYS